MSWSSDGAWFRPTEHPVVVLRPGQIIEDNGDPILHELAHAMIRCTELVPPYSPANRDHQDPRVWAAAGGDTSAQGRARALMLLSE